MTTAFASHVTLNLMIQKKAISFSVLPLDSLNVKERYVTSVMVMMETTQDTWEVEWVWSPSKADHILVS